LIGGESLNKNFQKIEKDLRSIAKRYKSVKYSIGLVILFLMMGLNAFSEEVNTSTKTNVNNPVETVVTREGIKDSVDDLQGKIKGIRSENKKSIEALRLELIQLMEQGNQVVKSPWTSWQFGINYVYNSMSGMYKGRGDKPPKYVYNSIYRRGNWEERNALDVLAGKTVNGGPITPGNESTNTWQITNGLLGGANLKRDLSIDASTNGGREWGLVELRKIREPLNEIEILARVSPKEVKKDKLDIPVTVTPPATLSAPVVKPNVNKPTEAPKVDLPKQPNLEIAQAPTINNDPEIKVLTVNKVGAITVSTPNVEPVDFFIDPEAGKRNPNFQSREYDTALNGTTINVVDNYPAFWGIPSGKTIVENLTINVNKDIRRAIVVDEGTAGNLDYFEYKSGTIKLNNTKNAGIDVQGTHKGEIKAEGLSKEIDGAGNEVYKTKDTIYLMKVVNSGNIIGVGHNGVKEQAAFAFNNYDGSSDSTRVLLVNSKDTGKVELNNEKSAGMMLRPEVSESNNDKNATVSAKSGGLNMQMAQNDGEITLNGRNSVGITVVKNYASNRNQNDPTNGGLIKKPYNTIIPAGQLLASRADEDTKSGILNTGTINVQGDDSSGVAILNMIQDVRVNGHINIGTVDPSALSNNGASKIIANGTAATNKDDKVEGSVGVYTEVATRPVRGREYTYDADGNLTSTVKYYDDHGNENSRETYVEYTNAKNETKRRYSSTTTGTETVEVGATIILGDNALSSYGLRNKTSTVVTKDKDGNQANYTTSGSITLLSGGKVIVKGKKNYGAVSAGDNFKREVKKGKNDYPIRIDDIGKIDINHGAEIEVTGEQSIGYAMLSGAGTNAGKITVTGHGNNSVSTTSYDGSLGFYGVKGTFYNAGTIKTKGNLAHAVVVKTAGMTFNHSGTIEVDSPAGTVSDPGTPGNIGVFSDGDAKVNFKDNSNVFVGKNSIGIYSEDKAKFNNTFKNHGTLNIKIGENSTFAYLNGRATTTLKEFFNIEDANNKKITVDIKDEMGANSSLVYADNGAAAELDADYTIEKGNTNASTMALLAANASSVTNIEKLTTNTQVALAAVSGSIAENVGTIISNRMDKGIGIYAQDNGSEGINEGTITMENINAIGMYGKDVAKLESSVGSNIKVKKTGSVGMYGVVSASATVPPFTVTNAGTIELEEGGSAGIYLVNKSTATDKIANLSASNTGTIKLKSGEGSIGIYAPKATISNVGTIEIANTATKSIAAYISDGGKITDASTANINLGTSGSNIAYYVKNAGTSIEGTDVGTVSGRGVGVYLEGTSSTDVAKLTKGVAASGGTPAVPDSPELNFTKGGNDNGDGIVGLYLKGNTDISTYEKKITVGNTVVNNNNDIIASAIGIYSNAQGVSGTPYVIKANIKTGTKAVGVFSAKGTDKSYIKYEGTQMDLGERSTGFYVNGGTELASPTINLNGGLVAYVTENSTFKGGTATINLTKSGIGVYGEKGAVVNVGTWTFNNNGNAAEEIRLKEGQAKVTTDKSLKPKMVLTHVINGETYLDTGKTVTAVPDAPHVQEENIGLMAQGVKATTAPANIVATGGWKEANYEVTNYGTVDFTTSKKSTAIYAESARVKNDGTIKLGESSTGIYGVYRADTESLTGVTNTVKVDTTANSNISLGKGSTGMYLVNAENLNTAAGGTIQSATGATNNVGIYAINGKVDVPTTGTSAEIAEANTYNGNTNNFKSLTMTNKSNITLGNGSVGIYTRGQSDTVRNTVKNDGNITVGDTLTGAPAVGIYAENTNLTQGDTGTPDITVGEKGIAFYGKNSTVTAKGTVNYSNKGILGYFEKSIFTSHYGDLTAHQNTILFLKNSTANMNGAGADIDITVPDKTATSDPFAGLYVEGTSVLNGVKKIIVGENSNGIFMKNATFTSNVTDIESTKEGAKGLLAVESDLTNNSKITLSGDSSIGIYSDASNTKTVTNNGKLTISGKKTLGAFLKGSQTFVNTADIDVADTTSSVPAEKTVGIYTKDGTSTIKHNSGTINVGEKSIGIFSATNSGVEVDTLAKINVKDEAIGIYKEKGTALLKGEIDVAAHTSTVVNSEPVGLYGLNGTSVTDSASKITVGAKSFGFILENETTATTNQYTSTGAGTVSLGNDSVFLYSNGQASLTNGRDISSNSDRVIAFYIKGNGANRGDLTNNATIDLSNSKGSIGIYAPGGKATNKGRILVGETDSIDPSTRLVYSDVSKITYGIGMAADNGGHIINDNEIRIYGDKSIGMYGKGAGTKVENNGTIFLDGSKATDTNKIQSMVGVYVDQGATFVNKGDIRTADAYAGKIVNGVQKVNNNVVGLVGVAVMNGSTLENHGNIDIDADESFGVVVRNSVIKNFGNFRINVRGRGTYGVSYKDISAADLAALEAEVNSKLKSDPRGQELAAAGGVNKSYEGVSITIQNGKPIFTRNGVTVSDTEVELIEKIIGSATSNLGMSDVGFYVDTLGRTKPIDINGATPPINSQLIVGTEYSELTNRKEWFVKDDVITPFLQQIQGRNFKLTSIAGSLTWMATPVIDNYGQIKGVAMTKIPYTAFVKTTHNAWNFADGLEQRYDMNALDSREKRVFNLLNSIGNNEEILLTQAYDEMMGHQYANVQQRIYETGNFLNKEFSYLRNEWSNPTKDANKVKVFGTNGEYKTDTAGIIDYKYNAQGVAYVHEDETVRLGESLGWYAGIVHNKYKFDDIGNSKEEMLLGKFGMFKSVPFDENNSLNWTISGDVFVGHNKMHRRFLVVSEIFNAKSRYYSYGMGIKNELSKEFRLTEGFALKPYGALRLEYGRMAKIKEKTGEVKLEVKSNDYISIKPEVGTELSYRAFFGSKSLKAAVAVAYENELGKIGDPKNKARVAGTSADWFNIRGEKEDRKGNVKTDLNIGVDNQRIGVTANVGYDTKGSNIRGGLGLRVIF